MEVWLKDRLSQCLDFDVPNNMIEYIMSIKSSEELNEYFATLLNRDYDTHRRFIKDCEQKLFGNKATNKKSIPLTPIKDADKKQEKPKDVPRPSKKKTKYVNLFSEDGKVPHTIMLKGRRPCDCEASQHKLVNNCMSCGRIVCEQEGSGPCLFCGELVCTAEEMHIIKSSTKKGEELKKSLQDKGGGEALQKALEQRDRLIEYDQNSAKRTEVIDDELDYFQENSVWLSEEERTKLIELKEEMHEKKHASRTTRKVKMDIFGREIEEEPIPEEYEAKIRKQVTESLSKADHWANRTHEKSSEDIADPRNFGPKPTYVEVAPYLTNEEKSAEVSTDYNRVQDKELLEMQDMRHCLSMHQPYASLLVAGIKKHEGRIWYSSHRGRLWIASTVREPHPDEVNTMEEFYKNHYKDVSIEFPSEYPTACLLGCVTVEDVITQEEYQKIYPNGESDSPYVFICTNPQALPIRIPVTGSHKIYKLDPTIHRTASLTLLRANSSAKS